MPKLDFRKLLLCFALTAFVTVLSACGGTEPVTLRLEGAVGTYTQQEVIGSGDSSLGTVFILKLEDAGGALPTEDAAVTISGPEGWNGNQSLTFEYPTESYWVIAPEAGAPPVAGSYQVEVTLGEEMLEQTLTLSDPDEQLELATITASFSEGATPVVDVAWSPISGATGYYVRLFDGTTAAQVKPDTYTLDTSVQFQADDLNTERTYVAAVYSANIDTVTNDPRLPAQFNMSDSLAVVSSTGDSLQSLQVAEPLRLERDKLTTRRP